MLEGLFSQLAKKTPPPILKVPSVPSHKTQMEPLQTTNCAAVPLVPSVPLQKTKVETENINFALTAADKQKILLYLESIKEGDQSLIDDLLGVCTRDQEALAWILSWADKVPAKPHSPQAWATCRSCTHFKSHNKHGGGAGTCAAGARSASHCQWSDTQHQCDEFKTK